MSDNLDPNDRGEYPIGPEPIRPRVKIRISMMGYDMPAPGRVIPYARREGEKEPESSVPHGVQFLLGCISPFVVLTLLTLTRPAWKRTGIADPAMIWLTIGGYVAVVLLTSKKTRWKGFAPGVLTATLVLPLVLLTVCGVVALGLATIFSVMK